MVEILLVEDNKGHAFLIKKALKKFNGQIRVTDVVSGAYLGWSYVNGIQCHHLAFRAAQLDWQIWVQTGDVPLPMKYVITSKWVTASPQYTARFRNWNTSPKLAAGHFEFTAPKGAKRLESMPVDDAGQLRIGGEQ